MIIGLSGYARSGKDTVSDYLVANYGFTKVSFAAPMREALYALNPIVGKYQKLGGSTTIDLQTVINEYGGWEAYKETQWGDEIRRLMQRFGTEVGREQFGQNFWVDQAIKAAAQHEKVVLSDVRFPNEVEAIRNSDGVVWRVHRDGVGAANRHASETALDDAQFDLHLMNNEDVESLYKTVDVLMGAS